MYFLVLLPSTIWLGWKGRRVLPCSKCRTVLNRPNWKLQLNFIVEHSSLCRITSEASKITVKKGNKIQIIYFLIIFFFKSQFLHIRIQLTGSRSFQIALSPLFH